MNTTIEQSVPQSVTIRIVFDGAPFAGKTTAAYSLSEALGGVAFTPAQEDGRTAWFDWMNYTGGRHDGKSIRVELVTVPGQSHLNERRRHLLGWGDVIVFIADTTRSAFADSVVKFAELQSDLSVTGDVPIIVIANKRDLDDALPLDEVSAALDLDETKSLIEGIATTGGGIRQAFIYAVRAALAHSATRFESTTGEALLEELKAAIEHEATGLSPMAGPATPMGTDDVTSPVASSEASASPDDAAAPETNEPQPPTTPPDDAAPPETNEPQPPTTPPDDTPINAADEEDGVRPSGEAYAAWAIRRAKLNRDGIDDGAAVVLLDNHWKLLVDIANHHVERWISHSLDSNIAADLLDWRLITASAEAEFVESDQSTVLMTTPRSDSDDPVGRETGQPAPPSAAGPNIQPVESRPVEVATSSPTAQTAKSTTAPVPRRPGSQSSGVTPRGKREPQGSVVTEKNQRYRALRQLRRTLRN